MDDHIVDKIVSIVSLRREAPERTVIGGSTDGEDSKEDTRSWTFRMSSHMTLESESIMRDVGLFHGNDQCKLVAWNQEKQKHLQGVERGGKPYLQVK